MKVTVNHASSPRLVAVLGIGGRGIYLPSETSGISQYIDESGVVSPEIRSLEEILRSGGDRNLRSGGDRKPIYEGDTVTLQF